METIFMNTKNSKTNESNRFRLCFTDKLCLRGNKTMALANFSIKSEYKNNKFKITVPTWDETFDLPDGSYTIADIQDYFCTSLKSTKVLQVMKNHQC